ncbi:MAG: paraquat-inducible protein A [Halioglobus sp.]|nr:paraquat-inducible protein A [Halioglobus sp.]
MSALTAASRDLSSCHVCYKLAPASHTRCPRCGSPLHQRKPASLQRTLALVVTACILYVPANLYPIMYTDQLGTTEVSTIIGGVVLLMELGSVPVALVIFVFSVVVPSAKLMTLLYLVWTVESHSALHPRQRARLYRITEFIGKWSMTDVFVVAILVALVHLGGLLVIRPGIAALSFAGVVIVTMLAAEAFDPRLIWDARTSKHRDH